MGYIALQTITLSKNITKNVIFFGEITFFY